MQNEKIKSYSKVLEITEQLFYFLTKDGKQQSIYPPGLYFNFNELMEADIFSTQAQFVQLISAAAQDFFDPLTLCARVPDPAQQAQATATIESLRGFDHADLEGRATAHFRFFVMRKTAKFLNENLANFADHLNADFYLAGALDSLIRSHVLNRDEINLLKNHFLNLPNKHIKYFLH